MGSGTFSGAAIRAAIVIVAADLCVKFSKKGRGDVGVVQLRTIGSFSTLYFGIFGQSWFSRFLPKYSRTACCCASRPSPPAAG